MKIRRNVSTYYLNRVTYNLTGMRQYIPKNVHRFYIASVMLVDARVDDFYHVTRGTKSASVMSCAGFGTA